MDDLWMLIEATKDDNGNFHIRATGKSLEGT
jgi:hypothetical protein